MKAKKVALFTVFLCCFFVGSSLAAVELTLFDKDFVRNRGKADTYTDSFIAHEHEARLIVRNGSEKGKDRISSASIILNGEEIIRPQDLNQKVYQKEFMVDLLEENTISVELASKPGSYLSVEVVQEIDADAAAIIGSEGGFLEIDDEENPIDGAKIEIPPEALNSSIILTMSYSNKMDDLSERILLSGPVIDFGPEGLYFNDYVLVTIPYWDSNDDGYIDNIIDVSEDIIMGFTCNDNFSGMDYLDKITQDTANNKLVVEIRHFSQIGTLAKEIILYKNSPDLDRNNYLVGDRIKYSCNIPMSGVKVNEISFEIKPKNNIHEISCSTWIDKEDQSSDYNRTGYINVPDSAIPGIYECILKYKYKPADKEVIYEKRHIRQIAIGSSEKEENEGEVNLDVSRMIKHAKMFVCDHSEADTECDKDYFNFDKTASDCMNYISRVLSAGFWITDKSGYSPILNRLYGMDWFNPGIAWFNFAVGKEPGALEQKKHFVEVVYPDKDNQKPYYQDMEGQKLIEERKKFVKEVVEQSSPKATDTWKSPKVFLEYLKDVDSNISGEVFEEDYKDNIMIGDLVFYTLKSAYPTGHIGIIIDIIYEYDENNNLLEDQTYVRILQHGIWVQDKNGVLVLKKKLYDSDNEESYSLTSLKNKFYKENAKAKGFMRIRNLRLPDFSEVSKAIINTANSFPEVMNQYIDLLHKNDIYCERLIDEAKKNHELRKLIISLMRSNSQINEALKDFVSIGDHVSICFYFNDILDCQNPYIPYLQKLFNIDILKGDKEKFTLRPDKYINRAEFAKMLTDFAKEKNVELIECSENELSAMHFEDIPKDEWFARPICKLYKKGIIEGYSDSRYIPHKVINMAEMLKMIVLTFFPSSLTEFSNLLTNQHPLLGSNGLWYEPYVKKAENIIKPSVIDNIWRPVGLESSEYSTLLIPPETPVKRQEAAKAFCDVSDYLN